MSNNIIQMYDKYKKYAKISLKKQDYNNTFNSIIYAAKVAYNFNWIYTDDDFENMLKDISYNFKKYKKTDKINNKRVIFYDCFAIINCSLSIVKFKCYMCINHQETESPSEATEKQPFFLILRI